MPAVGPNSKPNSAVRQLGGRSNDAAGSNQSCLQPARFFIDPLEINVFLTPLRAIRTGERELGGVGPPQGWPTSRLGLNYGSFFTSPSQMLGQISRLTLHVAFNDGIPLTRSPDRQSYVIHNTINDTASWLQIGNQHRVPRVLKLWSLSYLCLVGSYRR